MQTIEDKLEELREQWRREPHNRGKIEAQVRVLQIGKKFPEKNSFVSKVKESLF